VADCRRGKLKRAPLTCLARPAPRPLHDERGPRIRPQAEGWPRRSAEPGRFSAGARADDRGRADGGTARFPDHLGIDVTPMSAGAICCLPVLYVVFRLGR
jgi:hypothetical protein